MPDTRPAEPQTFLIVRLACGLGRVGADVTASVISNVLLWRGRSKAAVAVRVLLPAAGSLAVLGLADVDRLATTRRGRYVLAHMPRSAMLLRLAGDAVMAAGAMRRRPRLLAAGAGVIAVGWSHAAWPRRAGRGRLGLGASGDAGGVPRTSFADHNGRGEC